MKIYLLIFGLFLNFNFVFGQEKLITGRIIIDLEDSSPEGIYITNSRTQYTSITDLTGTFSIKAEAGDSLLIRSYFYESRRFYLSETLINKSLIYIHLNLQPIALDEAIIRPKLTGYLEEDVKYNAGPDPIKELYASLGINPDVKPRRDASGFQMWKDVSPLNLNVEKFLDVLTGDLRKRQNLFNYEDREEILTKINSFFGEDYFVKDLEIPKEKIHEFLFFTYETTSLRYNYDSNNYLKMMENFSNSSKTYLKRLRPTTPINK